MELFVAIVNGSQLLIIFTKKPIVDVAELLDPPLISIFNTVLDFEKL